MDRRRIWRSVRRAWIVLGLTLTVVFVAWSLVAYRAAPEGRAAARADAAVDVRHGDGFWSFVPVAADTSAHRPALVFFPGALVDPIAYAPLARAAAAAGFPAFIVELPRRGTMGGADDPELDERLDRALTTSGARPWIAAGHSRGAVVAVRIASEHRRGMAGLVLIGTTHPRDVDLSAMPQPVTKLAGTRDGLARRSAVEANRARLPASTRWVWIEGGNHSQFGWYGFQPGDRRATTAASAQREIMTREVLAMLSRVDGTASADAKAAVR